jgi:hypothetical protein
LLDRTLELADRDSFVGDEETTIKDLLGDRTPSSFSSFKESDSSESRSEAVKYSYSSAVLLEALATTSADDPRLITTSPLLLARDNVSIDGCVLRTSKADLEGGRGLTQKLYFLHNHSCVILFNRMNHLGIPTN